ncbi:MULTISPECIES: flagellar filament capping protein FliD [unclassified Fusibacter]|uniref:flagellar filament capping protein FliD n=1 Tax=unclassified Fusibacter TaxID=2624464 RepID=UPI0010131573|nr:MULTISPECIES: flagellar filament capping protein FliD [unclassified Fusibacter]MCK8059830.1 flagellar filament capping protein FliD [Fusibacter sp. A2]NPE21631.1 flagellar filament capping protein FliD [Fusibacter sp. A1]RXV62035.1 hypothetical protein DWB64_07290 [Fusibacter sp. A1]
MSTMRITGLSSGFDTDQMIKDLMKIEQSRVDTVVAQKVKVDWTIESYRETSNVLRSFTDSYFDVLKPTTNLRSASFFDVYAAKLTAGGVTNSAITADPLAGATATTVSFESITQLATKDSWKSQGVTGDFSGDSDPTFTLNLTTINDAITSGKNTFKFSFDGVEKTITLDGGYVGLDGDPLVDGSPQFTTELTSKLNTAFGTGFSASVVDNRLVIGNSESAHEMKISGDLIGELGFTANQTNYLNVNETILGAFNLAGDQSFSINGVDFTFSETTTIKDMMAEINNSNVGVLISYSTISDGFTLASTQTGEAFNIDLRDANGNVPDGSGNSFLETALKLDTTGRTAGQNAIFSVNGVQTSRASNTFTLENVQYTLNQTYTEVDAINVNITADNTDTIIENIKDFVESYNKIIDDISGKINEKALRDFQPLTSEEKEALSEDEVKLWEQKAKAGLLSNDPILSKILSDLRTVFYEPIDGLNISMKDIGISTSSNYKDNGKLVIDEAKLKDALVNKTDQVIELFTKQSSTTYSDTDRATRKSENGIAYRVYDILQDNIRTTRSSSGKKGFLIERAGVKGDTTEFVNEMQKRIKEYDSRIADLLDSLSSKEESYYRLFGNMESVLSQMDSQFQAFLGQLGG